MASEIKTPSIDYGIVIAFVAPGFVALVAISYHMTEAGALMNAASQVDQSVGVFLFAVLASLSLGLVVSGVRALTIDPILRWRALGKWAIPANSIDWSKVTERNLVSLLTIRNGYYRYYQFYSNTLVALIFWAIARALAIEATPSVLHWSVVILSIGALLLSARYSLKRYVNGVQETLKN